MTLPDINRHLSEEQLYSLLATPADGLDRAAGEHLTACEQCRVELAALQNSLDDFRLAATDLAAAAAVERTAPVMTPVRSPVFGGRGLAWSLAALVLAAGSVIPLVYPGKTATAPQAVSGAHTGTVDSDEALLEGISHDLATSVPPSLAPLTPQAAPSRPQP